MLSSRCLFIFLVTFRKSHPAQLSSARRALPSLAVPCRAVLCRSVLYLLLRTFAHTTCRTKYHTRYGTSGTYALHHKNAIPAQLSSANSAAPCGAVRYRALPCGVVLYREGLKQIINKERSNRISDTHRGSDPMGRKTTKCFQTAKKKGSTAGRTRGSGKMRGNRCFLLKFVSCSIGKKYCN